MLYIIWDSELIKTIPPFDSFIALGNFEGRKLDLFILVFPRFFLKIFFIHRGSPFWVTNHPTVFILRAGLLISTRRER